MGPCITITAHCSKLCVSMSVCSSDLLGVTLLGLQEEVLLLGYCSSREGLHLLDGLHAHAMGQHLEQGGDVHNDGFLIWMSCSNICDGEKICP